MKHPWRGLKKRHQAMVVSKDAMVELIACRTDQPITSSGPDLPRF